MLAPKQVSPTYINIYFSEISLYRVSALTVLSVRPLTFFTVVCAADSLLFNKIDERLRLARERREEREKQNAAKEAQWQAREERARQQYEKHVEERKKKLEEQRVKEEKRRAAVEEKRRQKIEEDRARHEAVIRRTMEKGQKTRQKPNRWSWGGTLQTNTPCTTADADRRSVSTMNLSKHTDPVITKRLSSSSATLLHSPDRGLRRLPLTPWESNMVNRLQQPTHSYLARSRSAVSLSGDQSESVSSPPAHKPSAGTTDPEEASRILAEKRRLAREQREREEEERRQQEEQARCAGWAMRDHVHERECVVLKGCIIFDLVVSHQISEGGVGSPKEEEEARQREEAERLRQERERHFQKEEAERLERKKRLEEIMKRTRRSETTEKVKTGGKMEENGEFEEVLVLPSHSRLSPPEGEEEQQQQQEDDRVPVLAFSENGLLKPLSRVDDISAQQGAGEKASTL
uniref:Microtubule-associated protein 7a n=1 Tax=Oreochromis niloticus TaxID=8128 RepID=A0A669F3Y4_ORENI